MPAAKKEAAAAAHDCKKDCELLHKEIAALKKEVQTLKAELKKAPKGGAGADPKAGKILDWLKSKNPNWKKDLEQYGL